MKKSSLFDAYETVKIIDKFIEILNVHKINIKKKHFILNFFTVMLRVCCRTYYANRNLHDNNAILFISHVNEQDKINSFLYFYIYNFFHLKKK